MSDISATETPNRRQRRHDGAPGIAVGWHVPARRIDAKSRNGLDYSLFSIACPECGERRIHNSDGLRRCPGCRTHYFLVASPAGNAA